MKAHSDKAFSGCIKKGFDFLGIQFGNIPEISKANVEKHRDNIARRYAQGASHICTGRYIKRWTSRSDGLLKCRKDVPALGNTNKAIMRMKALVSINNEEKFMRNSIKNSILLGVVLIGAAGSAAANMTITNKSQGPMQIQCTQPVSHDCPPPHHCNVFDVQPGKSTRCEHCAVIHASGQITAGPQDTVWNGSSIDTASTGVCKPVPTAQ